MTREQARHNGLCELCARYNIASIATTHGYCEQEYSSAHTLMMLCDHCFNETCEVSTCDTCRHIDGVLTTARRRRRVALLCDTPSWHNVCDTCADAIDNGGLYTECAYCGAVSKAEPVTARAWSKEYLAEIESDHAIDCSYIDDIRTAIER